MNAPSFGSLLFLALSACAAPALAQTTVTFPLPDQPGQIRADLYGAGTRAVILAHGGQFHKESWKKQAETLAHSGFLVLAIAFRGDALNPDGSPGSFGSDAANSADVLAAVSWLRHTGAQSVYAVGASMGGSAVGNAAAHLSPPAGISRMVFLGSAGGDSPKHLGGRKLFIIARDDRSGSGPRLPEITSFYSRTPQPKKLILLNGSAHAQFLFDTDQAPRVLQAIVYFLSQP